MSAIRALVVWAVGIVVVLGLFLIFVVAGWPGENDGCVGEIPNQCFCERFDERDVTAGEPGVRQPVNTWFNLYAIGTSLIVALIVYLDRQDPAASDGRNLMRSHTGVPDLYILAVLFLGLGSMWFHASLKAWGGVVDGASMYAFAAFLIVYSVRRFWDSAWFFWIGYLLTVGLFTFLHSVLPSYVNIGILVAIYLGVEIYIWQRSGKILRGKLTTQLLWIFAVLSILTATFFWAASQTGNFMCDPDSFFQPHGLLWHPLAGVTAMLLYFYWREADDRRL